MYTYCVEEHLKRALCSRCQDDILNGESRTQVKNGFNEEVQDGRSEERIIYQRISTPHCDIIGLSKTNRPSMTVLC